jgi:hypothetical protein
MTTEETNTAFDVFAREVLPELQRHDVGGDIGVTYDTVPAGATGSTAARATATASAAEPARAAAR